MISDSKLFPLGVQTFVVVDLYKRITGQDLLDPQQNSTSSDGTSTGEVPPIDPSTGNGN